MLIDWTSGGARWVFTGVVSLVMHVVLLSLLVASSGTDEEVVVSEGQSGDALTTREAEERGAGSVSEGQSVDALTTRGVGSVSEGQSVDALSAPPTTPETIGRAERGTLKDIGVRFDESSRVRNVGSLSEKRASASQKTQAKPQPRTAVIKKQTKAAEPEAVAPAANGGYAWRTVKAGESLTRIARECGVTPLALAKLNGYAKPLSVRLRVGQKIKVPAK